MKKIHLPKMFVVGNAGIDLYFRSKIFSKRILKERLCLALGGKYLAEEFYQFFGGGGANSSVSLAKQGFDVQLWSYIGNDALGYEVLRNLKQQHVNTNLVFMKAKQTAVSSILLTNLGDRTIINFRSNADLMEFNNHIRKEMKKRQWFVLYSLAHCPKADKLQFLKLAKNDGMKIFLSLHSSEYYQGLKYLQGYFDLADIVHLNAHELADIFGKKATEIDFSKTNFGLKLNIPLLLVSYDIHGSFAYTKNKIYFQPIVKEKRRLDTTGAGDAFSSGFLGKYIKSASIEQGLFFGAKNATGEIENLGAQTGLLYEK